MRKNPFVVALLLLLVIALMILVNSFHVKRERYKTV